MQRNSVPYIVLFSGAVCLVCSLFVSGAAVALREPQARNKLLDKQAQVLATAGLIQEGEAPSADEVRRLFEENMQAKVVDLETGEYITEGVDPQVFDQLAAAKDPSMSMEAPANPAQVKRVPKYGKVYEVRDENGELQEVVIPIQGMGLWAMMYGYVALESDLNTVKGITFYRHAETPGLGAEVDNPKWKDLWPNRMIYGPDGSVEIQVIKGPAAPPEQAPYEVDGLSGATFTSNGVTNALQFWLGETGFKPYIERLKEQRSAK